MLVFIDESGDPGFKLDKGSSPFFVVAMVVFDDHNEAGLVDRAIENLRAPTGHRAEFKFSKCRDDVRDSFCATVSAFDFVIRAIVVDKARVYSPALSASTERFYNYFVQSMMRHDNELLDRATVKLDESGDRKFKREMTRYLRRQLGRRVKKIQCVNSKNNNLIQLADMAAGAIHRCYRNDRRSSNRWFNQLRRKIQDVWDFQ